MTLTEHRDVQDPRTGERVHLTFTWEGGSYVEIAHTGQTPYEVINVWDYATDKPIITRTQRALSREVDRWIRTYGEAELVHDVVHNWAGEPAPNVTGASAA